jgi:DNA-binding response OmpR family regulator
MSGEATVLVADDEAALVDLYREFLADEYDVRTATDGTEALEQVDDAVDVVLLDRRMPDRSGDEVLSELRNRGLDCMVAMLTAVEPDTDIVEMPFDDYRVKPLDRSELLGLVELLVERATYDERSREFFRLASKKAALEVADNDDTDEYARLLERMADVRAEMDETLDRIGAEAAFKDVTGGEA